MTTPNAEKRDVILDSNVSTMSFAARSEQFDIELTVAWDGVLTSVRIGESTRGVDPRHIAEAVARTYGRAQQAAASRVADLLAGSRLPRSFVAQRLEERRAFEPRVTGPGAAQPAVPARRAVDTDAADDDFDLRDMRG